ncbi:hypothetical protein Tco_0795662 [Tanacetum coccineum]
MIVYADSDHVDDHVDRKSTSGIYTLMRCCLTSLFSKKQTTLSISTTESKYMSTAKFSDRKVSLKEASSGCHGMSFCSMVYRSSRLLMKVGLVLLTQVFYCYDRLSLEHIDTACSRTADKAWYAKKHDFINTASLKDFLLLGFQYKISAARLHLVLPNGVTRNNTTACFKKLLLLI